MPYPGVAMATGVINTISAAEAQHMEAEETVYWPQLRERMSAEEMDALYDTLVAARKTGIAAPNICRNTPPQNRLPLTRVWRTSHLYPYHFFSPAGAGSLGLLYIINRSPHSATELLTMSSFYSPNPFTSVGPIRINAGEADPSNWRRP